MEKCSAQNTHIFPFSSCLPSMFFLVCLLCPTCTHNRPEKHLFIHWAPPIQRNLPDAHANKWIYTQVKPRFQLQIALANGLHRWHGSPDGIIMVKYYYHVYKQSEGKVIPRKSNLIAYYCSRNMNFNLPAHMPEITFIRF